MAQNDPAKGGKPGVPGLVRVGSVSGAHGVRGALRVKMDNPESEILKHVESLTLAGRGVNAEHHLISAQPAGRGAVKVTLDGIASASIAAALRGVAVMVAAAELPPVAAGEFYYYQALGCAVVTTAGLTVGVIEEIFSNGANEVWVVRNNSTELLIPVIEDIVKAMDLAARQVTIEALPGLLD